MTPSQQAALEALVGRALTTEEVTSISTAVDNRYDGVTAATLSIGRKKLVPTEIGYGTIVATLRGIDGGGGAFLDTINAVAASDRDAFYTMKSIDRGVFRIDLQESRDGLSALAAAVPTLATRVAELLTLGYADDPISVDAVSKALNQVGV